jgi:hypothetical protein
MSFPEHGSMDDNINNAPGYFNFFLKSLLILLQLDFRVYQKF